MVHHSNANFINFGLVIFILLKSRILKLFTGHLFLNAVKVMLFISDTQYYLPTKIV